MLFHKTLFNNINKKNMPSEGYKQIPACKKKNCNPNYFKPMGTRSMESRMTNVKVDLKVENLEYKGNAVLRANKG